MREDKVGSECALILGEGGFIEVQGRYRLGKGGYPLACNVIVQVGLEAVSP